MPVSSEHEWFRDWFDELYLELYQHRDDDEARHFLRVLRERFEAQARRGTVDLACGAGRHSHVMADEFGWPVTGVDLSDVLLRRACATVHNRSPHPHFVRGDLRALPLADTSFSLAVNLFTSFGYFGDDDDHQRTLTEMARVLRPDGILVLDVMNPAPTLTELVPEDETDRAGWHIRQRRAYHPDQRRIVKTIEMRHANGDTRTALESVRLFTPGELDPLLNRAGFRVLDRWGDYDGNAYHEPTSPRQVVITQRRADLH